MRRGLGVIFQDYRLLPDKTVYENVAFAMEVIEAPRRLMQRSVNAVLDIVGLREKWKNFPSQLSGGEQQRVAIARAIAKRPAVLLCDEPTGALDSATGVRVLQALEQVNAEMGATTVIITHNADIARMSSRVLWMQDGQIVREQRNATRQQAASLQW